MRIEIKYKNKDLEVVGVDEFTLSEYCHLLSQKTLSLLYQIEELDKGELSFNDLKKYIFNLAGSIQRLPDNLIDEDVKESKIKKPDNAWFSFLKKRGD